MPKSSSAIDDAEVDDRAQHAVDVLELREHRVLGDLETEAFGGDAVPVERRGNARREVAVAQLARRHVDRHRQLLGTAVVLAPDRELGEGLIEHVVVERADQTLLLGDGNELRRGDQPALGVAPADQRFEADRRLVEQAEDRLVEDVELARGERAAQVAGEAAGTREGVAPQSGVEHPRLVGAGALGLVHREVGVLEELGGVRAGVGAQHGADAGGHGEAVRGQFERRADLRDHALGDRQDVLVLAQRVAHQHELVAAVARDRVGASRDPSQTVAELDQRLIADVVAERVVDRLEVVDVEEEDGEAAGLALERRDRLVEPVGQRDAVEQPGHRVVQRLVFERALRLDLSRHVAGDPEGPDDPPAAVAQAGAWSSRPTGRGGR